MISSRYIHYDLYYSDFFPFFSMSIIWHHHRHHHPYCRHYFISLHCHLDPGRTLYTKITEEVLIYSISLLWMIILLCHNSCINFFFIFQYRVKNTNIHSFTYLLMFILSSSSSSSLFPLWFFSIFRCVFSPLSLFKKL